MNDKYLNKKLYNNIKDKADKIYKKNSAYKSMYINNEYVKAGGKIKNGKTSNLENWRKEEWKNLSGVALGKTKLKNAPECGVKDKNQGKNPSICRPTKKVNKTTPKLAQSFNKEQLKKALDIKNKNKRINWNTL
jgi:predicted metal-dependent peptidase